MIFPKIKIDFKKINQAYHRILVFLHLSPLSLAEKCRIAFGAAVLLILTLALVILYIWMGKLTTKSYLDYEHAHIERLLRQHFQIQAKTGSLPALSASGTVLDPNNPDIRWFRIKNIKETTLTGLTETQKQITNSLLADEHNSEKLTMEKKGKVTYSNYIRVIRANDNCISCHNQQGAGSSFNRGEVIGVAVIQRPVGSEYSKTIFLNRFWTIIAGLISTIGAIIAFYVITQRVILNPIRQLRAIADNITEGNLDIRSSITTRDEYQRLADAFNHMLDRLQSSQEKLRQANKQLDDKIGELSNRNIELFKANKIKGEFIANVSHELRTPLNSILGFAQILKEKPDVLKEEKGQRYCEHIISSGQSLLNMINDLLNLAKIEAGKIDLRIEKTSLYQLCEDVIAAFDEIANQKKIKLSLKIAETLPVITTDASKVRQILFNFLSNAVKFTEARGSVELAVFMLDEQTVRLAVSDTGCGIARENLDKIFEKFSQADGSITRQTTGTGLGLAISKELASLIAAGIGVESEVGKGSTFCLDLPVNLPAGEEKKD